jgi:hypothetical protein
MNGKRTDPVDARDRVDWRDGRGRFNRGNQVKVKERAHGGSEQASSGSCIIDLGEIA